MVFKNKDNNDGALISGETEAWNVAEGFVKLKILRLLIQLDRYEIIAQFGTEEMDQDLGLNEIDIAKKRIEGLQRFVATLKQLIGNVQFALKKDGIKSIKNYKERIKEVENVMDGIFEYQENQVTHDQTININDNLFRKCFTILKQIKDEINTPMNKAGLIFKESDGLDLDKMMDDYIHGG